MSEKNDEYLFTKDLKKLEQRNKGYEAAFNKLADVEVTIHTESGDEPLSDTETECHDWWRCSKK